MKSNLRAEDMQKLKDVALGKDSADVLIRGGMLVNVYSGELLNNWSVAIKGEWIAAAGQELDYTCGKDTRILDASGKVIAPGFIEAHTHLNNMYTPYEFLRYAMAGGTTTIITECEEIIYNSGVKGVLQFLEACSNQPVKFYTTIPAPLNLGKSSYTMWPSVNRLKKLLHRDDVIGTGEAYWQIILGGNDYFTTLAEEALSLGKSIEGHAAGAHNEKLLAYVAHGIKSCHEAVSVEDVLERLRLGLFVMIRQGSIRQELEAVQNLKDLQIDFSRISLVTDGMDPRDLVSLGYLETSVQKAIDLGFDLVRAIQMVTINPATHFRLDHFTGGITPARQADIVVLPDKRHIKPDFVLSKGRVVAEQGKVTVEPRKTIYDLSGLTKITKPVSVSSLSIYAPNSGVNMVRIVDMVTDLVSREYVEAMPAYEGQLQPDSGRDILKLTLVSMKNKIANAFIRGIGLKDGAVASSYLWETYGILAVGTNDADMIQAVNRIIDHGGGIAVCARGSIRAELPLPVAGLITDICMEDLVQRLLSIQAEAEKLGCRFPDIFKTLSVLCTGAIPFIRITEDGLYDLKSGTIVDMFVSG